MKNLIQKLKHYFGKHNWVCVAQGGEASGGQLFGGAFYWTRYECTICHEVSGSATESLFHSNL